MAAARGARDQELLDAVDAFPRSPFDGPVWRIVRAGRDPLRPAAARGRWDDGTFEVLYTSAEADGARAEVFFHLDRGQPVFPTNVTFRLFELHLRLEQGLESASIESLPQVGIDPASFGSLTYVRLGDEYSRSQQVAEAAHFLGFDGLIVPSARWSCANVIAFADRVPPDHLTLVADHGPVDWAAWRTRSRER